jgi:hypothetical protein
MIAEPPCIEEGFMTYWPTQARHHGDVEETAPEMVFA